MSQRTTSATSNPRQDGNGDSVYLTNLDDWRYTQMHPNNYVHRPMTQQGATPTRNLYHNPRKNGKFPDNRSNMQYKHQQVSYQNQYLPAQQQAHHQNFQQHFHQRSSKIMEQAPLMAREREHYMNMSQAQLAPVRTSHPIPNTSFYKEMEVSDNDILNLQACNDSLRRLTLEILGKKEKLKNEKQALVNKVERLEIEYSELLNAFQERNRRFDYVYGEAAQELRVAKEELEKKSSSLEKAKLRVQKKEGDLAIVQNKLREVRMTSRKNRKALKKLRESVTKRDEEIKELKRKTTELKANYEMEIKELKRKDRESKANSEKEINKLRERIAKLEHNSALQLEDNEKMKDCFAKWINRYVKKHTKEVKLLTENNSSKVGKRFVKSKSGEQKFNSSKIRKLGGEPSQVNQGPGGGGATLEKFQKVKTKNDKWNIKNYVAKKQNNLYHNTSSSAIEGVGNDKSGDTCQKETFEKKNEDWHKKRVCSIAKTRLPQWKHLRQTGDSSLVTARQNCKQLGSNFRKN